MLNWVRQLGFSKHISVFQCPYPMNHLFNLCIRYAPTGIHSIAIIYNVASQQYVGSGRMCTYICSHVSSIFLKLLSSISLLLYQSQSKCKSTFTVIRVTDVKSLCTHVFMYSAFCYIGTAYIHSLRYTT